MDYLLGLICFDMEVISWIGLLWDDLRSSGLDHMGLI